MHLVLVLLAAVLGLAVGVLIAICVDRLYPSPRKAGSPVHPRLRSALLGLAGAALFTAASLRAVDARQFLLMCLFGAALLTLTTTDFERRLLPNRIMYPFLALALLLCWAWPQRTLLAGLEGGVAGTLLMLAIFLVFPGFGFGDVKLAGLIGLILGFPAVLYGLLVGMVLGGLAAAWLLLSKRAGLRSAMAYGPYLAGGAIVEMLIRR